MKQPFILITIGALMLLAAVINAFIPIMAMIMGLINMTGGTVLESILSILQMMIDPSIIPTALILLAVLTVLSAAAAGLLLPGYLLIVDDGLSEGPKQKGLFINGLRSYFFKIFIMTVETMLCTAILAIFLMVACVPAIVVTKAALSSKPDLLIAALFVDILTVGVVFMCLSFFKAYIFMWYISAVKGSEKPFLTGKAVADKQFWNMALAMAVFDLVLVAGIYLVYLSDSQMFRYTAGWVLTTGIFTMLSVYLVNTQKKVGISASTGKAGRDAGNA